MVERLLKHEKDMDIFETGARALGRIRTPDALAVLKDLALSRATPACRDIIEDVLSKSDPDEAFHHHFARLLQGSASPTDANEGAHQLANLLTPESFGPLQTAVRHPDILVFRHAIRLLGQVPSREAADFLLELFKDSHREALEDREVRSLLTNFRTLPHGEVLQKTREVGSVRWEPRRPGTTEDLASGSQERIQAAVAGIRALEPGFLDTMLLDTLLAATQDKPAHLASFLTQAGDLAQQRARRNDFALDTTAMGLADMVGQGLFPAERLLPELAESLRGATGHTGVAGAFARLVPPGAEDLLTLLLEQPDGALRSAALEILGERKDPALRAALLKLRRDRISDIADRALWHLGQLPDPEGTARRLLNDPDPEEIQVGLRFVTMHRLWSLVPDLLERAATESREPTLIATLEALGAVGSPEAVDPLLALLHATQTPRVQLAIGTALRDLGDPRGALALCTKAQELTTPLLHVLAVEALAKAHAGIGDLLPHIHSQLLLKAVKGGWSERNPWPLRRRMAEALVTLHSDDRKAWIELCTLYQTSLDEKRSPGTYQPEDITITQSCVRTLTQRSVV